MMRAASSRSERVYAALLRLFPRAFTSDFGPDMRDVFRDHLNEARRRHGAAGVLLLWLRTVPDLLLTGIQEHEEEMFNALMHDARYAARILLKNPVFTLVAVAVVALGTRAVSTIFSVANAVVLRPIPGVAQPSRVVAIERVRTDGGGSRSASYPYYQHIASGTKTMNGIAAVDMLPITISTGGEGKLALANLVTANYFDVLGVHPALGRFFVADEDRVPEAAPVDVPLDIDASPDARVLVVTIAVALFTGIVFGLAPALRGSRADVATSLRGDGAGAGRSRSWLRNALVAAQVAASLLLLTTSGLFMRALARGHRVDPGYDVTNIATTAIDVSLSNYDTVRARTFYATLGDRLRAIPGVTAVAYAHLLPLSMNSMGYGIVVPGYVPASGREGKEIDVNTNIVDPGYFDALRLPLVAGRGLLPTDDERAPHVAVVSEALAQRWRSVGAALAQRFWPGTQPIGHTFKLDSAVVTVVGVARDVKFAKLDERRFPFMYLPVAQNWRPDLSLMVRTSGDALQLAASVVLLPQRFAVIVTASLGVAGLLLAAIGLDGVLSFSTAQRTREMGVRVAVGATSVNVIGLVVGEGMKLVGIGVAVGLVLAAGATQALRPFLFGVNPLDGVTFVVMAAVRE